MIKPVDNLGAMRIMESKLSFPLLRLLHRSMLTRRCHALVCADRYLEQCDEKRNTGYQFSINQLQKEWSRLRLHRFAGSVLTDYRILKNYAARLMKGPL